MKHDKDNDISISIKGNSVQSNSGAIQSERRIVKLRKEREYTESQGKRWKRTDKRQQFNEDE
jgi:hypothetical protein